MFRIKYDEDSNGWEVIPPQNKASNSSEPQPNSIKSAHNFTTEESQFPLTMNESQQETEKPPQNNGWSTFIKKEMTNFSQRSAEYNQHFVRDENILSRNMNPASSTEKPVDEPFPSSERISAFTQHTPADRVAASSSKVGHPYLTDDMAFYKSRPILQDSLIGMSSAFIKQEIEKSQEYLYQEMYRNINPLNLSENDKEATLVNNEKYGFMKPDLHQLAPAAVDNNQQYVIEEIGSYKSMNPFSSDLRLGLYSNNRPYAFNKHETGQLNAALTGKNLYLYPQGIYSNGTSEFMKQESNHVSSNSAKNQHFTPEPLYQNSSSPSSSVADISKDTFHKDKDSPFVHQDNSNLSATSSGKSPEKTKDKSNVCGQCSKEFASKYHLTRHIQIHLQEKPFICKFCSKAFAQKRYLDCHLLIHTDEKPFVCTHCSKAFRRKDHLKNHVRIHSGDKPYACHFCPKVFINKYNLDHHIRTHTKEKPYICEVCSKAFGKKQQLTFHIKIHLGEKERGMINVKCPYCPLIFDQKEKLDNHKLIHQPEEPHVS